MDILNGNVIVFTDQHFGVKGNSPLRQKISALAMKRIIDAIDKHNISACIFCGDYFHQRNAITIDTLNIAHRCLQALAKRCKTYMILGNHDLFNKNSTDINSIRIFNDIANVVVIDKPFEMMLNGKMALLVPWLADLSSFNHNTYDYMFGHFEISSKFLISSYVQDHAKKIQSTSKVADELSHDNFLNATSSPSNSPDATIGSFIELSKPNGVIFAGHIHQHKEMVVKGRNFIFVGSPYQQNLGDYGSKCGYYVISSNNSYKFNEIQGIPVHVKIECSKVLASGVGKYDFSCVHNNIVQKIYDVDVDPQDDIEINKKISSFKPYEELLPEYKVALDMANSTSGSIDDNMKFLISKSKLEYINSYIEQLDNNVLASENIEKKKLLDVMHRYYSKVAI